MKFKPIYLELLSKAEGISDDNPMAGNITTSFVIIAVWLASDRRITTGQGGGAPGGYRDVGFPF